MNVNIYSACESYSRIGEQSMSNNEKMVSVPPFIGLEPLVGRYYPAMCRRCGWVGSSEELTEDDAQCTRDIGDRLCLGDCDELERHDLLSIIQAMTQPADQPHGDPVALPARKLINSAVQDKTLAYCQGWNAYDDEIAKLGPLYSRPVQGEAVAWMLTPPGCVPALVFAGIGLKEPTPSKYATPLYAHSDPTEVERLHERHEAWVAGVEQGKAESASELAKLREDFDIAKNEDLKWQGLREQEAEIQTLRTQLAEAHALLVDIRLSGLDEPRMQRLDSMLCAGAYAQAVDKHPLQRTAIDRAAIAALSASAEPSAPKCKTCKACHGEGVTHTGIEEAPTSLCNRCDGSGNEPSAPVVYPINMKTMMQAYEQVDHKALLHGTSNWCAAMATALRATLERKP